MDPRIKKHVDAIKKLEEEIEYHQKQHQYEVERRQKHILNQK